MNTSVVEHAGSINCWTQDAQQMTLAARVEMIPSVKAMGKPCANVALDISAPGMPSQFFLVQAHKLVALVQQIETLRKQMEETDEHSKT